jgi:hypothetical protein
MFVIFKTSNKDFVSTERTYIRVNLFHPQGTKHFSQHFIDFLSLSSIPDLIVWVLTCLQAPFVPPQKTLRRRTRSRYRSPEHSLQPLWLNRSHRTDHLVSEVTWTLSFVYHPLSTKCKDNLIYLLNFDCISPLVWGKEVSTLCLLVIVMLCDYGEKSIKSARGLD